jgi:hypothetical protein
MLASLEACAWAAACAAISAGTAISLHASRGTVVGAALTAAAVGAGTFLARRWRAATAAAVVIRRLEQAEPRYLNLLVTADESRRGVTSIKPVVRDRVFADAAAIARGADPGAAFSMAPAARTSAVAVALWLAVAGVTVFIRAAPRQGAQPGRSSARANTASAGGPLRVNATIQPPDYTGLAAQVFTDPPQLQAVAGSALMLSVTSPADRMTIEHDGVSRTLTRGADGRFTDRTILTKTGFIVFSAADDARRVVPVVVSPDALPAVKITAPGRDLIVGNGNSRITFDARATDDFGLRALALRYTKVSGSGEQFAFKEGEIPLSVERDSARSWRGVATRTLADFDLHEGDMLVYRAVAADARPGDGSASSDAFFIEISRLGAAAGDSFTLPEEETRYALSQQMLIVKTERLIKQQPAMPASAANEAALNLAVEQRMIRAEFVFMLGGEVEDEEVEAEQSTELQEGRLQNRGQRDVRAATQAMSIAQKYLTGGSLTQALAAERAAVAALQRAFSKDRYILRALATRSQLDPARRLTGDLSQASDWRRRIGDVPANRRTALLQDLLRGLGAIAREDGEARSDGEADRVRRNRLIVLAEEALRIDPESAALRQASADLQRVADTWSAMAPDARIRAVRTIAASVAEEARRAMAAPPAQPSSTAPALHGAFAGALRAAGGAR